MIVPAAATALEVASSPIDQESMTYGSISLALHN